MAQLAAPPGKFGPSVRRCNSSLKLVFVWSCSLGLRDNTSSANFGTCFVRLPAIKEAVFGVSLCAVMARFREIRFWLTDIAKADAPKMASHTAYKDR